MARGVQIALTLNPRDFIKGLKTIETDLDDVKDALDDLGDTELDLDTDKAERGLEDIESAAQSAGEEVESELESGAEAAESAFANLAREAKSEIDEIETAARNADVTPDFDSIGEGIESTAGSAKQAVGILMGEIAEELTESWGEAVRSGDYGDAIRETFSNLAQIGGAAFGPVGAVGGAIGAVVLTGLYDKLTDSEAKARISEATGQLFDSVESAELSGAQAARAFTRGFVEEGEIGSQIQQALGTEDVASAWSEVGKIVGDTGLDAQTVTEALLGQPAALAEVQTALGNNKSAYEDILTEAQNLNLEGAEGLTYKQDEKKVLDDQAAALSDLVGLSEEQVTANEEALAADQIRRGVTDDIKGNTKGAKDNVQNTKDKGLPTLKGDAKAASDKTGKAKSDLENMPDPSVKLSVDRAELNAAIAIANSGLEVPVWLRVQNQNAIQAAIGGSLAGDQSGLPRAGTGTG